MTENQLLILLLLVAALSFGYAAIKPRPQIDFRDLGLMFATFAAVVILS